MHRLFLLHNHILINKYKGNIIKYDNEPSTLRICSYKFALCFMKDFHRIICIQQNNNKCPDIFNLMKNFDIPSQMKKHGNGFKSIFVQFH